MGCLPWVVGGIVWAVTTALSDSGWWGFLAGVGAGIVAAVVAKAIEQPSASITTTKPSETAKIRRPNYTSHCWYCQSHITSVTHRKCTKCGWYICNECRECGCRYKRFGKARRRRQ